MYLVDTDVVSALRKPERSPHLVEWIARQRTTELYLSVVSVGEIERGIARQQRRNPAHARVLASWLDSVLALYGDRILPTDLAVARRWGHLSDAIGHRGADLLIAATAFEHGLTVVTGNIRHFEPTGVPVVNPFSSLV